MTDDDFLVLNSVYLRKIATAEAVAECSLLPLATVRSVLSGAQDTGQVLDVGDGAQMLSDQGVQSVLRGYAERYAGLREDPDVTGWYDRFEVLNGQFLATVSAWQQADEPDRALDRLRRIVDRQVKALGGLCDAVARYAGYRARFERALDRVDQGEADYVVSPHVDSIHNIWFEFHEDILTLLGRPRDVAEAPP